MSSMDEESFADSDEEYVSDDNGSDAFDAPPIHAAVAAYEVLDVDACRSLAEVQVKEVCELLCCDTRVAEVLLRRFCWDLDKLTDKYMSDPEAVAAKAGVSMGDGADRSVLHVGPDTVKVGGVEQPPSSLQPVQCSVCYESTAKYTALECGHPFCNSCYTEYLTHKIADEGLESYFVRCPEPKCQVVVPPDVVRGLAPPGQQLRQYENAASMARSFVDDQANIKWCPAANCGRAVKSRSAMNGRAMGVACSCKHRFCFSCMHEDHSPSTCDNLAQWTIKCRDDSETYNWLVANTKACPKCQTSIEKNGGCNHMTCKNTSCKYEFCWVCIGPWKDHSGSYYNCNKFDPEKDKQSSDGEKKSTSRMALERYLHYYTRFTNHRNSLKLEVEAKTNMEAKIKQMETIGDNTWMDCQYLLEANEALHSCRYTLQFTYVFAFYLTDDGNFKLQFENQQAELESQTDELAGHLEKDVAEIDRMQVVHCYKMAEKRLSNLMELVQTSDGYTTGAGSSSGAGSS